MMKKVLFHDFRMFFIVFDHANACARMCLLVEIHNNKALTRTPIGASGSGTGTNFLGPTLLSLISEPAPEKR